MPTSGNDIQYKYLEAITIRKLQEYIDSTYSQHYVGNAGIQTLDVWESLDIASEMCQGTAIKYLMRYGKKDGFNEKDLLKAMHYIILMMYFAEKQKVQAAQTVKESF